MGIMKTLSLPWEWGRFLMETLVLLSGKNSLIHGHMRCDHYIYPQPPPPTPLPWTVFLSILLCVCSWECIGLCAPWRTESFPACFLVYSQGLGGGSMHKTVRLFQHRSSVFWQCNSHGRRSRLLVYLLAVCSMFRKPHSVIFLGSSS